MPVYTDERGNYRVRRKTKLDNFYEAWWYIQRHPNLVKNPDDETVQLEVLVTKVNPNTREIDNDPDNNTKTEVWLELIVVDVHGMGVHWTQFDCGASTYEDAVLYMAKLIKEYDFEKGNENEPSED